MKSSSFNTITFWSIGLYCAFVVFYPLTNTDIWWHLASAREMLQSGGFLHVDPFSFTPTADSWINIHWFFQLISYAVHATFGIHGLVTGKSILFGMTCVFLAHAIPGKKSALLSFFILGVLVFQARYLVLARPVVFTLLFIALYLFLIERFLDKGKFRYLVLLLPLQIVWANSQGLFILGPLIIFLYILGGWGNSWLKLGSLSATVKTLYAQLRFPVKNWDQGGRSVVLMYGLMLDSIIACLITPYGFRGLMYPFKLFFRIDSMGADLYSRHVSENAPVFSILSEEPRYAIGVCLVFTLSMFALMANRQKLRIAHVLLIIVFFYLSLLAKRNVILFYMAAAPILCHYLAAQLAALPGIFSRTFRPASVIGYGCIALLLFQVIIHGMVLKAGPTSPFISPFRYPQGGVNYLKAHPVRGNMFNSIRHGGYLLWHRYPDKKVFIDGRLILRTPALFGEYLTVLDRPEYFGAVQKKFQLTHVLLPAVQFPRYRKLARYLYTDSAWSLVQADGESLLFVVDSLAPTPALDLESGETVRALDENISLKWKDNAYLKTQALSGFRDLVGELTGGD